MRSVSKTENVGSSPTTGAIYFRGYSGGSFFYFYRWVWFRCYMWCGLTRVSSDQRFWVGGDPHEG